jgi:hypothetical protein
MKSKGRLTTVIHIKTYFFAIKLLLDG